AHEPGVLFLGDRKTGDEEFPDEHTMDRPLILLRVRGPHEEIAGRNPREVRRNRGCRASGGDVEVPVLVAASHRDVSIVQEPSVLFVQKRSRVSSMKLEPFALERMQSTFENQVDFNLSESGVHPLDLGELVEDEAARQQLLAESLRYTQSNGTVPLRTA